MLNMSATISARHLTNVQALRGLAALLVLVFHIAAIERAGLAQDAVVERALLSGIWDRGYAGVDLFFVISGFVMVYVTGSTGRSFHDVGRFLRSRIARIYPLWWLYAGIMALYFWVSYQTPADPERAAQAGGVVPYLLKSFALIPQQSVPVLGLGWTLIHEMYFYFVFALILFLPRKYQLAGLGLWAGIVVLGFASGFAQPYAVSMPTLVGSLLSLEFIAGALVGWVIRKRVYKYGRLLGMLGLVALLAAFILYTDKSQSVLLWGRVAVFTIPFALLVYGASALELTGQLKAPKWAQRLGDWSYSLYLSHFLVLRALRRIFDKFIPHLPEPFADSLRIGAPGALDNIVFAVIGLVACIVFAGISYKFIERPLLKGARKILRL